MDISVLIATHRRDETLRLCLDSLCRIESSALEWELLLIDNAGEESTRELAQAYKDSIDLHYLVETTPGKNSALNRGLGEARGQLYVFSDNDIIASKDWLLEMWRGAARWPQTSVFAGRILPKWPSATMPPLRMNDPLIRAAFCVADWDIPEGRIEADRVWGPNMAVRAELFKSGLRFDPAVGPRGANYVMGSETELTRRLEKQGFGAVYLPNSLVWHQIREEQLTREWLYARAYRAGRGRAHETDYFPGAPRIFGVPRFLIRRAASVALARLGAFLKADREEMLLQGMTYWRVRGSLDQCFFESRARPRLAHGPSDGKGGD